MDSKDVRIFFENNVKYYGITIDNLEFPTSDEKVRDAIVADLQQPEIFISSVLDYYYERVYQTRVTQLKELQYMLREYQLNSISKEEFKGEMLQLQEAIDSGDSTKAVIALVESVNSLTDKVYDSNRVMLQLMTDMKGNIDRLPEVISDGLTKKMIAINGGDTSLFLKQGANSGSSVNIDIPFTDSSSQGVRGGVTAKAINGQIETIIESVKSSAPVLEKGETKKRGSMFNRRRK